MGAVAAQLLEDCSSMEHKTLLTKSFDEKGTDLGLHSWAEPAEGFRGC